jgi:hypothetical protein
VSKKVLITRLGSSVIRRQPPVPGDDPDAIEDDPDVDVTGPVDDPFMNEQIIVDKGESISVIIRNNFDRFFRGRPQGSANSSPASSPFRGSPASSPFRGRPRAHANSSP